MSKEDSKDSKSNMQPQRGETLDDKTGSQFCNQIHIQPEFLNNKCILLPNTFPPSVITFPIGEEIIPRYGIETTAKIIDSSNNTHWNQQQNGDWMCITCGNLNFSFRTTCNRCHKQTKDHNSRLKRLIRSQNVDPSRRQQQQLQPKQSSKNQQIYCPKNHQSSMSDDKENIPNYGSTNSQSTSLNIFAQESKKQLENSLQNKLSSGLQESTVNQKNLKKNMKKLNGIDQIQEQVASLKPQSVSFYPQNKNKTEDNLKEKQACGGSDIDEKITGNRGFNSILLQLTPQKGFYISDEEQQQQQQSEIRIQSEIINQLQISKKYELKDDLDEKENDQDQQFEQEKYVNQLLM